MSKKTYDHKEEATHLAKVLKYNPEYITDEDKFDDLVTILEVRLMQAFFAAEGGKKLIESVYQAPDAAKFELPLPRAGGNSN